MELSTYYLIDNKVKFYFESTGQILRRDNKELTLQRREAQTIKYILDNRTTAVKAEQIAAYLWGEGPVNDDFLNKKAQAITHISRSRKRLEALGLDKTWLRTSADGYQVVCTVECITDEQQRQAALQRESLRHKRQNHLKMIKYSGVSAFLTASILLFFYLLSDKPPYQLKNIVQLHRLSGVSVEPRFSNRGDAIAFSYQTSTKVGKIYIKTDSDINYRALTTGYFDQSPAFSPSGQRLAFQRTTATGCEIRLINLDHDYNPIGDDELLIDCDQRNDLASIVWLNDNELVYTDHMNHDWVLDVAHFNLENKEKSLFLTIDKTDYYGAGYYYLTMDQATGYLYLLDGQDWSKSNIYQVDVSQGQPRSPRLIASVKDTLHSIGILPGKVLFKGADNKLKVMAIDDPSDVAVVHFDPLNPISNPIVNPKGDKIAFITGEYFRSQVHTYNLQTGLDSEVLSSAVKLRLPKAKNNEILVTSKESGINQIYRYSNNNRSQLTNFTENHNIIDFAVANDKHWLAISFDDKTNLYRRSGSGLTLIKRFELMSYPDFSADSQRMLLSQLVDIDNEPSQVFEYDLASYEKTGKIEQTNVDISGAKFALYHPLGIIYASSSGNGINLLTYNSDRAISPTLAATTPHGMSFTDSHLYVAERNNRLVKIDLKTYQVEELPHHLYGSFSINHDQLFHLNQTLGHMDIVVADLVAQ